MSSTATTTHTRESLQFRPAEPGRYNTDHKAAMFSWVCPTCGTSVTAYQGEPDLSEEAILHSPHCHYCRRKGI